MCVLRCVCLCVSGMCASSPISPRNARTKRRVQQVAMKENKVVTPIQWQRALPHMFIWIDVCCVPQPAGGPLSTSVMPEEIARSGFTAILDATLVEMEVASPVASPLRRLTSAKQFGSSNKYGQALKGEMREKLRAWDTDDAFRKSQAQIYDSRAHYEMYLVSENAKAVQVHLESATEEKEENECGAIVNESEGNDGGGGDSDDDKDGDGASENDNVGGERNGIDEDGEHQRPSKLASNQRAGKPARRSSGAFLQRKLTSDHRHTRLACPPWLTHTKFWLDKAVLSIAAYVERSCMILVRANKRKRGKETDRNRFALVPLLTNRIFPHPFLRYLFRPSSTTKEMTKTATTPIGARGVGVAWSLEQRHCVPQQSRSCW